MTDQTDRTILPDPPEIRLASLPDVPVTGTEVENVAFRATYRVRLTDSDARRIEQLADEAEQRAREGYDLVVPYLTWIKAAGIDLLAIAALLDFYADHGGDGVPRSHIHLAAAMLESVREINGIAGRLLDAVDGAETLAEQERSAEVGP